MIELCDLWRARVRTLDGKRLGRVHDVHVDNGRIVALACGPGSLIERLTAKAHGHRIPWECVRRISGGDILVTTEPPERKGTKPASASHSRRGTRRPSGPRSAR
ncbi:PRC-barrel domain-containing protein [Sphingomonas sp.]|uniref:PRC-barrel domain-containing protein n=1 Tax=Sphingomonas sp. TaxID=28214 RepID=UPI00344B888A|nr:PRC-barrel domain-containing protein [Sphingomonas sp.]